MGLRARLEALAFCAMVAGLPLACAAHQPPPPPTADKPPPEPPFDDPATCTHAEPVSTKPDVLAGDMPVADASALDETGNRGPQGIRRSVRSHYPQIRACYERGLGRHPTLRGRVMLRFVIDRDGTISELVVADNQVPDCSVVHCLRETMARVTFSPASVITTVQYPIVFEPAD